MRFDGWNTIEGRHLVAIYATVFLVQGGYFAWVAVQWMKLRTSSTDAEMKKSTRPV